MSKIDYHNRKYKKMKCYLCGEDEKKVDERVIRRFCWKCLINGNYNKYQLQRAREERLEALNK